MKPINLLVIVSAISLLLCSKSFASDDLECGKVSVDSGTLTGKLVKLISKDGWITTNYTLQTDNGEKYCVRDDTLDNPIRNKIVSDAFFLESRITVSLTKYHAITGIAIH
ncbi:MULTISPECIES: hypothetical protein [unclassified Photorhabdus]|uniref:hypothetical protein n=1 Tax=unclassified Photorhabdus TaxID=2620880 RepID=UPI000DCC62F1|nr:MULTISPECIES: hypothetical protein [unclassified Photorhabdus]RAW95695.1 hypothetical protein CKY03_16920 [Photorhabdus sp. S9-53]RAW95742.1 hypothetical protein CKY05_17025 [Photorhabdus sp. S10-54]RAX00040.1 hypothetical protein CKY04_16680 [Photorhabdus sp. S8-52]